MNKPDSPLTPASLRTPTNSSQINKQNKADILNIVWKKKLISRADIARITGLSATAITRNVHALIQSGRVKDIGIGDAMPGGGRPPNMLVFNDDDSFIIGINLGSSEIEGVITNLRAQPLAEMKVSIPPGAGFKAAIARASQLIGELVRATGVSWERVWGVGMAVAGLAGAQRRTFGPNGESPGHVSFALSFPWEEGEVEEAVDGLADLPFIFDKLSRTIAHGEMWFGSGAEFSDFISVNFGHNSVAAGIIINGQSFSGIDGHGGGFGHITLDHSSELRCACGNYGCLQALTSAASIELSARKLLASGRPSLLRELCKGEPATLRLPQIIEAGKDGDPLALEIFRNVAHNMGLGVAAMINILNPQAIFIGGQAVTESIDNMFDMIVETATASAIGHLAKKVRILPATLGPNAARLGAVSLILEEILNLNISPSRRRASQRFD